MIQFNQQYIRDYLKPFIRQVLTDMSAATDKNDALYKIRHQIAITENDKDEFKQKYFQGNQPANRPFTKPEDEKYQDYFIEELKKKVDAQIRLSKVEGMEKALLPDTESGREFGTHQALTRNLNQLAITMARSFEKRAIKQNLAEKGEMNEENERRLENGELKLVEVDGEEQVVTEEEVTDMAQENPQATIIPSIEPNIEKTFEDRPLDEKGAETPQPPEKKEVATTQVREDFDTAKRESIREILTDSGLEVVGEMTIENGVVRGTVIDVEGQELVVNVDTKKPNYAADKFIFIFTENGPHGDLKGKRIPLSQNDLQSSFIGEKGERKTAEKVFKEQDARGKMVKEKYQPPKKSEAKPELPPTKPQGEVPKAAELNIPPSIQPGTGPSQQVPGKIEGKIPTGPVVVGTVATVPVPSKTRGTSRAHIEKTVEGSRIKGPQPVKKTIVQKKKQVKEQRVASADVEQRRGPLRAGPGAQEVPVAQPQQKKGMPTFAKLAIATGGGGIGFTFWGAWHTVQSQADKAEVVLHFITSCLGTCIV